MIFHRSRWTKDLSSKANITEPVLSSHFTDRKECHKGISNNYHICTCVFVTQQLALGRHLEDLGQSYPHNRQHPAPHLSILPS